MIFYEFLHFLKAENWKLAKFRAQKMAKRAVFQLVNCPKLISRNLWMTEKSWNYHTDKKLFFLANFGALLRWVSAKVLIDVSLIFHYSLQGTRAKVWKHRIESPLFCVKTYASDLEKLFRAIWERFSRGEKSDHITVLSKKSSVC